MQDARNNPDKYPLDPSTRVFSTTQLETIEELTKPCEYCQDLDEMDKESPDEPHHGSTIMCDECGAEYYEPYGGNYMNVNEPAKLNHPELKTV